MANGTSRIPSWLSTVARGVITVVTLPIQLVVRLVERVVAGKEGVKKMDEEAKKQEAEESRIQYKEEQIKMEDKDLKKALEETDLSGYGDLTIKKVSISPTNKSGANKEYEAICENGKSYTLFSSKDGLIRSGVCPDEVEVQLAKLIDVANVKRREPSVPEQEDNKEDVNEGSKEERKDDNDSKEEQNDTSFHQFTFKEATITVEVKTVGEDKGVAECRTSDGGVARAVRDESGMIIIRQEEGEISPKLQSLLNKATMTAYEESFPEDYGKLKPDFIDKTHNLLSKAIKGEDDKESKLLGVVCGNTLFTPEITEKCAVASSNRAMNGYAKPVIMFDEKDNGKSENENKIHTMSEIAKTYSLIQSKIAENPKLPVGHFTTDDAVFVVTQHNNKPEISTFTSDVDCGVIENDRRLSVGEVQTICKHLVESKLVDSELNKDVAKAQFNEDLYREGESTFVLCAGGYYAYVEHPDGKSPLLHIGAVDGSIKDTTKEMSEECNINTLVEEVIDGPEPEQDAEIGEDGEEQVGEEEVELDTE